jgi:hypothetical protein
MEREELIEAKEIMGLHFIGPDEIKIFLQSIGKTMASYDVPAIPFSKDELLTCQKDYLLVLTIPKASDDWEINIQNLRAVFGTQPDLKEPCFYNQDWYMQESFIRLVLPLKWRLVKKTVGENTRALAPAEILKDEKYSFPTAIFCAYTFFIHYIVHKQVLWEFDFVWCSDSDHNNDRIYVGKYKDADGLNKNGFSIHRHLSLRNCYGAISVQG